MLFNVGDLVTRISHNHDVVFKIKEIKDDIAILQGFNIRLMADSSLDDLTKCESCMEDLTKDDSSLLERLKENNNLNRDEYFYLPGKILHIDADKEYLDRCLNFYKDMNVFSYGVVEQEKNMPNKITYYLENANPDILVITGHDAYYNKDENYIN